MKQTWKWPGVVSGALIGLLFASLLLAASVTYQYDELGRLKLATYSDGSGVTYTLDAAGNRKTVASTITAPTVALAQSTYTVGESAGSVVVSVTRSGSTASAATVHYATANGTATAGADYTAVSGTLSWVAGDAATKTITIPITNDTSYEGSETFTLALTAPTGVALGATTQTTVTITDNDTVSFAIANASVNEAAGSVTLTVTKTGASSLTNAVSYASANGTATAGSDYTAVSGTLSFTSTDTTKTISVPITNDTVYEGNETFTITLSAPTNGATITTTTSTVTIIDDDVVSFSVANATVNEGAGTATVTITKTGTTATSAAVNYATANGTALAGSDYTAASGTLTFAAADASKTFTVPITDDAIYEGSETFSVTLASPTNGATLGTATATVTITDNEVQPSFSIANASSPEGTPVVFTITRSGATGQANNVNYATANGTATAGGYYAAASGTLTFAAGDTSKTVSISTGDDNIYDVDKTFTMNLSSATNLATIAQASATGTIVNNDAAPTISVGSASVLEGGTLSFTVSIIGATNLDHAVNYATANGTAIAGSDYTATSGTITFAHNGAANQTVNVVTIDDSVVESSETLTLNLSAATNGATISTASATGTIIDNDTANPTVPQNMRTNPVTTAQNNYTALWDASSNVSTYKLERSISSTFATSTIYTVTAPTTSMAFTQANSEMVYYFRVSACNSGGTCSATSNVASIDVCGGGGCTNIIAPPPPEDSKKTR